MSVGIPQVPPTENRELHRFLSSVKEILEIHYTTRGGYRDASVTLGMLIDTGILTDAQAQTLARTR